MATVSDIINADSRRGDVASGGGDAGVYKIDTNPLEKLAAYTNFYKLKQYDQSIKDRDTKIEEIAKTDLIDLNNLQGKDRDYMYSKLEELKSESREFMKNPNITLKEMGDWKQKLAGVQNDYNSGKLRAATYYSQKGEIESSAATTEEKQIKISDLDKRFSEGDIKTKMSSASGFKPEVLNIPPAAVSKINTLQKAKDNNGIYTVNQDIFVPTHNDAVVDGVVSGISSLGKGLSGIDKEMQDKAGGSAQLFMGMGANFNSQLAAKDENGKPKYFDTEGNFLESKFKSENRLLAPIVDKRKELAEYSQRKLNELSRGVFNDINTGLVVGGLKADDFQRGIIKFTPDGISAEDLGMIGVFSGFKGDASTKSYQKTGLGIDQQQVNTGNFNAETARMKAITDQGELQFKKDQAAAAKDIAGKTPAERKIIETPSALFQEHVDRVLKFLGNSTEGKTVSYDAIDPNTRKALGIADIDKPEEISGVKYTPDGGYQIYFNKKSDRKDIIGTIDDLKQGYINVVKGKEGMVQGFQEMSEQGFASKFAGRVSGKDIWEFKTGAKSTENTQTQTSGVIESSAADFKAAGWTDDQIRQAEKAGKIKIVK